MAQCFLAKSGGGSGLKNITSLFNSYSDNTNVAITIFGLLKWAWFAGANGRTTDYYASATSSQPHYVEFIVGSAHGGAGDSQVDSYYKVYYKTEQNGAWKEASYVQGVWEVKQKIYGVRVYLHIQSTSSMHYPFIAQHRIIGKE